MELRKDYILDRWVIISEGRSKRPHQFKHEEKKEDKVCFFCPGNEHMTPDEIVRIEKDKKWTMRVFPNKFAAVEKKGEINIETHNTYFTFANAYGSHEIIVETNDHKKQLWDLNKEELKELLSLYNQRIIEINKDENIKYVCVIKNHGKDGGTSLIHSHSQIIAYNHLPTNIQEKIDAYKSFAHCPMCDIWKVEKKSDRKCFENNTFIAFTPYASRFNYEILVMPKRHVTKLDDLTEEELNDFSEIWHKILVKLNELGVSFNHYIHYSPDNADLHLTLEICPRIAKWAGFEISSNTIINSVSPESAAEFYRE